MTVQRPVAGPRRRAITPRAALVVVAVVAMVAAGVRAESESGSVSGTVRLSGPAPRSRPIRMEADPHCAKAGGKVREQDVVAERGGGLANVFVRLEGEGLSAAAEPPPAAPIVIEQRGCIYHPRMTGARVGQTLQVVNLDDTIHNVRSESKAGSDFNIGQPFKGMEFDFELAAEETMLRLRCDIHPWMHAFIGVVGHPWFAVTGEDGRFEIEGVPAGRYDVVVWHERFGAQRSPVSLDASGIASVDFEYDVDASPLP